MEVSSFILSGLEDKDGNKFANPTPGQGSEIGRIVKSCCMLQSKSASTLVLPKTVGSSYLSGNRLSPTESSKSR